MGDGRAVRLLLRLFLRESQTDFLPSCRLTRDRPRFPSIPTPTATSLSPSLPYTPPPTTPDPLEAIKFVCKDVWVSVFDKQVDNLRTNHRGVWVVLDTSLRGLRGVSVPPRREGAGAAGKKGETEEEKQLRRWVGLVSLPSTFSSSHRRRASTTIALRPVRPLATR